MAKLLFISWSFINFLLFPSFSAALSFEDKIAPLKAAAEKGDPQAHFDLLQALMFGSMGDHTDIATMKKFADLARKQKVQYPNDSAEMFKTIDRCYEAGAPAIPAEDQPTAEEKKAFQESKADCLVFQVGKAKDLKKYRKCLLSQKEIVKADLIEVYANGWGGLRNEKLAIALACHSGIPQFEMVSMVEALEANKSQELLLKEFTTCDFATSLRSRGRCVDRYQKAADKDRDGDAAEIIQKWTPKQKNLFRKMRKQAQEFFNEHAISELNRTNTMRDVQAAQEKEKLKEDLLGSIREFESGETPKENDFTSADQKLNEIYSKIMSGTRTFQNGTARKEGVKATQRKWLKYRDAWVQFAASKYPNTSSEIWKTWLTQQRIEQLKTLTTD